jgi:hypothetical protein
MRLYIDNSDAVPALVDYLRSWSDTIVEQVGEAEIELSLLGSYRGEAMEQEITVRVQAWADAQRARGLEVAVS